MQLQLEHNLAYVSIEIVYRGVVLEVPKVILDTGSATTLLSVDYVERAGIVPEAGDRIHNIYGVGGVESVFMRNLDSLEVGGKSLERFSVDVGGMDYARGINGILGMDFLLRAGAVIDLHALSLEFAA
jgi:hypothetical protein